jgi:hypothetical protein
VDDGHGTTPSQIIQELDGLAIFGRDQDWMVWWAVDMRWSQVSTAKPLRTVEPYSSDGPGYALSWKFGYSTLVVAFFQRNGPWRKVVNQLPPRVFPPFVPAVGIV